MDFLSEHTMILWICKISDNTLLSYYTFIIHARNANKPQHQVNIISISLYPFLQKLTEISLYLADHLMEGIPIYSVDLSHHSCGHSQLTPSQV